MSNPSVSKTLFGHLILRLSIHTAMLACKAEMQNRPYKAQALLFLNKRCWRLWHALR